MYNDSPCLSLRNRFVSYTLSYKGKTSLLQTKFIMHCVANIYFCKLHSWHVIDTHAVAKATDKEVTNELYVLLNYGSKATTSAVLQPL